MWYTQHIIINIMPALFIYIFSHNLLFAMLFYLAAVLIDVDHFFGIAILDKTLNPIKIFNTLKSIQFKGAGQYEEKLFCILHTFEFVIIFTFLSTQFIILIPVLYGFLFHLICDFTTVGWDKNKRIFFLTFFIKKYLNGEYNAKKRK